MALIFNSITQFVIQPERTKKRVKRDDLDTLSEVWIGPSALEDTFVPAIGNKHSDFSLMTVLSSSVKRLPMYVSEVTIEYHGKLDHEGSTQYTSVPTISQHWAEGEVAMGSSGTTISRRYSGRCVQIDYLTNRRPSGNPSNIGLAQEFLGFANVWDQVTSFGSSTVLIAPPIKKLSCTDVKVEDKADGWYRVTETYQSKMYPGESISGAPGAPATVQGRISVGGLTGPPISIWDVPDWYGSSKPRNPQSERTKGAAEQAATDSGNTLKTTTVPGSVAADTAQQTGVDAGWFTPEISDPTGSVQTQVAENSPTLAAASIPYNPDGQEALATLQSALLDY